MIPFQSKYTSTLCVRNLAENVSLKDLQNEFGRFGNIVDIMIPVDYHTRMPKGYCFIEFEDFYQAEDAFYSLHLSTFFGEKIEIDYAKSDWKSKSNKIIHFNFIFNQNFFKNFIRGDIVKRAASIFKRIMQYK